MDAQLIRLWGTVIADVAATYVHNLTRTGKTTKRFERSAVNDKMPVSALPGFALLTWPSRQRCDSNGPRSSSVCSGCP